MVDNSALRHGVREAVLQLAAQGPVRLELYDCGITQSMPSSWAGGSEADTYRALLYARRAAELEREALALRARGIAVVTLVEQHTPLAGGRRPAHQGQRAGPDRQGACRRQG